jgi:hypothetical protein
VESFWGKLMGNWVSFLKIWEWSVTLQNLEQKTPLVKLTVEMDGSLSWLELIEDNLTQEKSKKRWDLLLEIDWFSIVYYPYWNSWAKEYKYLVNLPFWETQIKYCIRNFGRINSESMSFGGIIIILGNLLLAGLTTALHISSVDERLLVGKFIGIELILSLNFLIWMCVKDVIRDTLWVENKVINKTATGITKQIHHEKYGFSAL